MSELWYGLGGAIVGGIGGLLASRMRSKQIANKAWPFLLGDATLVLYDVSTDTIEPYAIEKVTDTIYMSVDGSLFVVIPQTVRPAFSHHLKRPIFLAIGGKASALAMNPDVLSKIGIASLTVKSKYWETSDKEAVYKLLEELYRVAGEKIGAIPVTSDTKIAIAVKTPEVIKSIVSVHAERGRAVHRALLEIIQSVRELQELQLKMEAVKIRKKYTWLFFIIAIIMVVGIVLAILRTVGFFAPSPPPTPQPSPTPIP